MAGAGSKVNENEYPFWVNRYAGFVLGIAGERGWFSVGISGSMGDAKQWLLKGFVGPQVRFWPGLLLLIYKELTIA
jgi:hypothetical protein